LQPDKELSRLSMRPYKSTILAKYITACFNNQGVDMNITKIQKLTYIAYGSFLALYNERLVDEYPQAWPYGPVFPTTRKQLLKIDLNAITLDDDDIQEIRADRDVTILVDTIYATFGHWSAAMLSEWSHKEGSPWEAAVSKKSFKWGDRMDDDYIKSYFDKIIIRS